MKRIELVALSQLFNAEEEGVDHNININSSLGFSLRSKNLINDDGYLSNKGRSFMFQCINPGVNVEKLVRNSSTGLLSKLFFRCFDILKISKINSNVLRGMVRVANEIQSLQKLENADRNSSRSMEDKTIRLR